MALSIPVCGRTSSLASLQICTHYAVSHFYHSRLCVPYLSLFSTTTNGALNASISSDLVRIPRKPYEGNLSLIKLSEQVDRADRKRERLKCKVLTKADPVDTRSFPFAEKRFTGLNLPGKLLQRLKEENLEVPTDVQVAAIPTLLDGHDAALQSYTGSGKTLAYLLPILSRIGPLRQLQDGEKAPTPETTNKGGVEALIVVPSRELAMQIVREAERILGPAYKKVVQQLIGGANQNRQEDALKRNKPLIVVGTPGRISEISRAGKLHTHGCRFLVLDEADQLLSTEFRVDMRRILEHVGQRRTAGEENKEHTDLGQDSHPSVSSTPPPSTSSPANECSSKPPSSSARGRRLERQTVLVSATMPPGVLRAAAVWGHRPLLIRATSIIEVEKVGHTLPSSQSEAGKEDTPVSVDLQGAKESMPPNLEHSYVVAPLRHHVDILRKCIHALDAQSVTVFMNHSRRLKDTEFKLQARGISAGTLHGELNKMERANVLTSFRNGKLRVLLVSEVGARGLDIPNCDLVVNLELPTDGSHYAHRGGRTGRLGRKGTVVSVCEAPEEFVMKKFARQLGISITPRELFEGKLQPYQQHLS